MGNPKDKTDAFISDLKEVVKKHFGDVEFVETEPLGMQLRKVLPTPSSANLQNITTTTTVTLYPSLDTDSPDSD